MEPKDVSCGFFRRDQGHAREIGAIASAVACQLRQPACRGVGADKKIRKDSGSCPTRLAVLHEDLAGEEERVPRRPRDLDRPIVEHRFQILDPGVADRQLSVDHVVDAERPLERRFLQLCATTPTNPDRSSPRQLAVV